MEMLYEFRTNAPTQNNELENRTRKPRHLLQFDLPFCQCHQNALSHRLFVLTIFLSIPVENRVQNAIKKTFESNINFLQRTDAWAKDGNEAKWLVERKKSKKVNAPYQQRIGIWFDTDIWDEDVYWSRRFNRSAIMVIVVEHTAIRYNTIDVRNLPFWCE